MPTIKPRINISFEQELFLTIKKMAQKNNSSLSSIALALIKKSIELEEDIYFSEKADDRLEKNEPRISHFKAWK